VKPSTTNAAIAGVFAFIESSPYEVVKVSVPSDVRDPLRVGDPL
jgi:hypothetical protein